MTATLNRSRSMPSLEQIANYWMDAAPAVFPELQARIIGWGEPSCFRCGWLAPIPEPSSASPWRIATGWLERAHLQDHALDGPDTPENLVPLCPLCHQLMPSFKSPESAIEWVKRGQPLTCPWWWQWVTDGRYGGDQYAPYPGFSSFRRFYLHAADFARQFEAKAARLAQDSGLLPRVASPDAGRVTTPGMAAGTGAPVPVPAAT